MTRANAQDENDIEALTVVGLNHRSAPLDLRESLYVAEDDYPGLLRDLRHAGLTEAVVLCTCDRIEVLGGHADSVAAASLALDVLARRAGLDAADLQTSVYRRFGGEAVRHVFAVAASLDSQLVGEPQVLGQLRWAHRLAAAEGMTGPLLEAVLQATYVTAKRVRGETEIGRHPVSIAAATLRVARDIHGDLSRCRGLLLGVGEMGEFLAERLIASDLNDLTVIHKLPHRAEELARRLGCHFALPERLEALLKSADIVLTAQGSGRYALTPELVEATLKRRRRQPIFIVDAGVPGDVDPSIDRLEEAYRFDLQDLERIADAGRANRSAAAEQAWAIVDEDVDRFLRSWQGRGAVPALVALRRRFEDVRQDVLRTRGADDAAEITRRLINRLLHDPTDVLRRVAAEDAEAYAACEHALKALFRIGSVDEGAVGDESRKADAEEEGQ
jgi:glutamyl-tRNA reductase